MIATPWWLPWLGGVGITLIVATGKIFAPLRDALTERKPTGWLGQLISCSMCLGFWVGLANGWAMGYRNLAELLWSAGALSVLSYTADAALLRLGDELGAEEDEPPATDNKES